MDEENIPSGLITWPEYYAQFDRHQLEAQLKKIEAQFKTIRDDFFMGLINNQQYHQAESTYHQHVGSINLILKDPQRWRNVGGR